MTPRRTFLTVLLSALASLPFVGRLVRDDSGRYYHRILWTGPGTIRFDHGQQFVTGAGEHAYSWCSNKRFDNHAVVTGYVEMEHRTTDTWA